MMKPTLAIAFAGMIALSGCLSGGNKSAARAAPQSYAAANPYLWRATLDTLAPLPMVSSDPIGGLIIYDWRTFESAPNERIKATVYILDSRLRADGVKVSVHRQVNTDGTWTDAAADPATGEQLENKILERARLLKASEIG